jgi:uncharacterized membrane protein HdeD (DUF308 family)
LFWIALVRAFMAVSLGLALLVQEEKTRPLLLNFMGIFWLVSGLLVLRAIVAGRPHHRFGVVAALLGVGAGLAVLLRSELDVASDALVVVLLGLVILLTGILHALGGFEEEAGQQLRWRPGLGIGVAEVVLGAILVASPLSEGRDFYWAASIWALCAGMVLIADALRIRSAARHRQRLDSL